MKWPFDYLEEAEYSAVGQRKEEEEDKWGGSGPETSELIFLQNTFIPVLIKAIIWLRWLPWKIKHMYRIHMYSKHKQWHIYENVNHTSWILRSCII